MGTQRALSVTQRAFSVTQRALSVTQRALSVNQRALRLTCVGALSISNTPFLAFHCIGLARGSVCAWRFQIFRCLTPCVTKVFALNGFHATPYTCTVSNVPRPSTSASDEHRIV
jgi:hypothetical protein